jgi:hypothetical protein
MIDSIPGDSRRRGFRSLLVPWSRVSERLRPAPQHLRVRVLRRLMLAATVCLAATGDQAGNGQPAPVQSGWIDSFDGPASDYEVIRGSETLAARYLMPLLAGDRVLVRRADGLIRIRLGEMQTFVLNQAKSPYEVRSVASSPTVVSNFMRWASEWFTELHSEPSPAPVISPIGRGESTTGPASGLLFAETVALGDGVRPLSLAWRGGTAPFRVRLMPSADTGAILVDETGILERTYRTPEVHLKPGQYLLEISDSLENKRVSTLENKLVSTLDVVEADEVPRADPSSMPADLADEVRRTVSAAWLATQKGGWRWRLEAYQQVVDLDGYPPAVLLRAALQEDSELPGLPETPD